MRSLGGVFAAVGAACLLAVFPVATSASAGSQPAANRHAVVALAALAHGVLADINAYRQQHHLRPLRISASLTAAARQHTEEMAVDGYFNHPSANGTAFWRRIQGYYPPENRHAWEVGENLLWSSPGVSARKALQLWIASPEHRRNLLTASWRDIGISAVHVFHAPGAYRGLDVTIVTTDFGVRG